jgi:acyl carrier protein
VVSAVEAAILALPRVANAAVTPQETGEGDVKLIAHIEARAGERLDSSWLRQELHERLPAHGVPARFVLMDALPLTASGKVDRANLPDPGTARPLLAQAYVAPRSEAEARVVEIWCEMLSLDTVGVHDDFYDLGGDSLALVKMLADLEASEGVALPLQHLRGAPTPARLASVLVLSRDSNLPDWTEHLSGVTETFENRPRQHSRKWKHRIKEQVRNVGPVLFGHALPYRRGLALHHRAAARFERDPRFNRFLDAVRIWHERLSTS